MKDRKGFTLIELLAVIIILGILMIIAIPSVTKYISDSRKNAYVDTAKEVIGSARNLVNSGDLEMYATDTTYYIPTACIKTENDLKSPYGDFTKAYVGVIYDGKGYKYYWISVDDAGQGVSKITPLDKLDTDDIESDLKDSDIESVVTTTGIGNRSEIKILDCSTNSWDKQYHLDDTSGNASEENGGGTPTSGSGGESGGSGGSNSISLGDYISLTPTQTSYTISTSLTGYSSNQIINPSELNLWRVIDIHNNGSFDVVSEYTSSTNVSFRGIVGYANLVGSLNTIAAQYQVSGKTIGSRHIGYGGQTEIISNTSAFDGTTNTAPSTTSTPHIVTGTGEEYSGGVLGDNLHVKDYQILGNVYSNDKTTYGNSGLKAYKVGTSTPVDYWLASRMYNYTNDTSFVFFGTGIDSSGALQESHLRYYLDGWGDFTTTRAIRPILTLKSGITISGGSGTKDNPYTLS